MPRKRYSILLPSRLMTRLELVGHRGSGVAGPQGYPIQLV